MPDPEDVLFSPAVKAEQTRLGSRAQFEGRTWNTEITAPTADLIYSIAVGRRAA